MNSPIFVNICRAVESVAGGAAVRAQIVEPDLLVLDGPLAHHELKIVHLRRPTPGEVERASDERHLLVLTEPSRAAREAAGRTNHINLPQGGLRIVLPGIVLIAPGSDAPLPTPAVRLRGKSGIVAESLILNPNREWTLRELARDAQVSLGLAQRVFDRLHREGLISVPTGADPGQRATPDLNAILKLWGQESHGSARPFARAHLYATHPLDAIGKIQGEVPGVCMGGAWAANTYVALLTHVPAPYRVWVPHSLGSSEILQRVEGMEIVNDGANMEFYATAGDPWRVHANEFEGALRVSRARSFVELYESKGRMQELAEAVLESLR